MGTQQLNQFHNACCGKGQEEHDKNSEQVYQQTPNVSYSYIEGGTITQPAPIGNPDKKVKAHKDCDCCKSAAEI